MTTSRINKHIDPKVNTAISNLPAIIPVTGDIIYYPSMGGGYVGYVFVEKRSSGAYYIKVKWFPHGSMLSTTFDGLHDINKYLLDMRSFLKYIRVRRT